MNDPRLTLSLSPSGDDVWQRNYERTVRELTFRRFRIAGMVYLVAHLSGFFLWLALQPIHQDVLVLRLVTLGLTAALLATSYLKRVERWAFPLTVALTLVSAAYMQQIIFRTGDAQIHLTAVCLIIVATGLLFPYRLWQMLSVGLAVLGAYVLGATAIQSDKLVISAFYIACAIGAATVAAHVSDRLRRSEFKARQQAEDERQRAEALLRNILPDSIVSELKRSPRLIADRFSQATILFADIVGFTPLSAKMDAEMVVSVLNDIFSSFDALSEKHGLEKIKTIGDCYMVAGGLPSPRDDHAAAVARMALDMREVIERMKIPTGERLQLRIGINTGPVVAGVIGKKKFLYDLWGDAVNTASRMESHADEGMIQVTQATYLLIKDEFALESCGTVVVKGKGEMQTWRLTGVVK
jgi:class 3 adenylate cyclase